jgi:hypothetical protein
MKEFGKPDNPKHSKRIRREVILCILAGKLTAYSICWLVGVIVNVIKY